MKKAERREKGREREPQPTEMRRREESWRAHGGEEADGAEMRNGPTENKGERRSDSKGGKICSEDRKETERKAAEKRTEREGDERKEVKSMQKRVRESRSRDGRKTEEPEDSVDQSEKSSGYVGEKTSKPRDGDRGEDVKEPEKSKKPGDDEGLGEKMSIEKSRG